LRRLGAFCKHFSLKPKQLATLSQDELYNLLLDYVSALERAGGAGSHIESALKAVKSWLAHNGIEIRRKIKIRGVIGILLRLGMNRSNPAGAKKDFLSGDKKARVACVLVAHSGLRLTTLGNYFVFKQGGLPVPQRLLGGENAERRTFDAGFSGYQAEGGKQTFHQNGKHQRHDKKCHQKGWIQLETLTF